MTLLILALLAAIGVAYIFSTGYLGASYPVRPNWLRQCAFLAAGTLAGWAMSRLDNRGALWRITAWGGYGMSLLLLALVLVAGREIGGARRWLSIGPFLLQPAEFAKVFTLLVGAQLTAGKTFQSRWKTLLATVGCFALPIALMLLEPSYGNAGSLLPPLAVILCLRFCPRWLWCMGLLLAVALLGGIAGGVTYLRTQEAPPAAATALFADHGFLHDYHLKRLHAFLSPEGGWNEQQSLMTVAGGGWFGKGYLNGTMKRLGFLPRTVAPTDFIFAVIAEEGGLLFGTLPVLALYSALFWMLLHRANQAAALQDLTIVAAGCSLLFVHVLVGVGMSIRLVPVIGLPLPLLSYGGSFTMATMLLLGAMLGTRLAKPEEEAADTTESPSPVLLLRLGPLLRIRLRSR